MDLRGSLVAIVTPFRDGQFDEKSYADLIEFQIENGTAGIVPCGTTGESATLTHAEHVQVIEACVKAVRGRVPVVAGTGSNSTREAIQLTQSAKDCGADAALLITPYYNKPPQQGLYEHYEAVAQAVDIPQVVYNCPGRTGVSIAPDTLARLERLPQIVAVKDATGDLDWTTEVHMKTGLTILSGDDTATLPMYAVGGVGVISVTANVAPAEMAEICRLAEAGDREGARAIHEKVFQLTKILFIESNPVPVKWAMHLMGKIGPEIRLPLSQLSEQHRGPLAAELARMGVLPEMAQF
jgi:4-hydroxy-tetrahydrodipicolinate synthase